MMREWFSLDGVKCDDLGIAMLGYKIQPLPDQEVGSILIPGMHGAYDVFTGAYRQREVVIQCAQLSEDEIDLAENLWRMKNWVSGKRRLMLWDREGVEFDASLSTASDIDNQALWGEFKLTFRCDPVGHGVDRVYPVGVYFENGGNSDSPCVVRITPALNVDGLTVTHSAGFVRIYGALIPEQTIEIDGIKRYVTIGGVDAMPRLAIDSAWPMAAPGPNIITANTAVVGDVRFRERWT